MGPFIQGGEDHTVKKWHEWFAWRPVKVNGKWIWLKKIYRKGYREIYNNANQIAYEYVETLFDLVRLDTLKFGPAPTQPSVGQIWKYNDTISYIYDGTAWRAIR